MTLFVVQFIEFVHWEHATELGSTSALLPDLIEALAPLGMPDVQYASRKSWGTRTRAATYAAFSWAQSRFIYVAAVLLIHLAAIRYVFLPVGAV